MREWKRVCPGVVLAEDTGIKVRPCGADLYLDHASTAEVAWYGEDTGPALGRDMGDDWWTLRCGDGHVLLLPESSWNSGGTPPPFDPALLDVLGCPTLTRENWNGRWMLRDSVQT